MDNLVANGQPASLWISQAHVDNDEPVTHMHHAYPQGTLATFAYGLTRCACPKVLFFYSRRYTWADRAAAFSAGRLKGNTRTLAIEQPDTGRGVGGGMSGDVELAAESREGEGFRASGPRGAGARSPVGVSR